MKLKKSLHGNVEKTFLYRLTLFSTRYVENCGTRSIFRYTYFFRSKIFFSFFLKSLIGWKFDRFQVRLISIHKKNLSSIGPQEAEIDFWVGGAPLNKVFRLINEHAQIFITKINLSMSGNVIWIFILKIDEYFVNICVEKMVLEKNTGQSKRTNGMFGIEYCLMHLT
jgi:hypothetical protein